MLELVQKYSALLKLREENIHFYISMFKGYGLTESTAGMFIQELNDSKTDCCGKPNTGAEGRLVNWNEGNYKVTDHPNPRGEIILGGDSIAKVGFYQTLVIMYISSFHHQSSLFCFAVLLDHTGVSWKRG